MACAKKAAEAAAAVPDAPAAWPRLGLRLGWPAKRVRRRLCIIYDRKPLLRNLFQW